VPPYFTAKAVRLFVRYVIPYPLITEESGLPYSPALAASAEFVTTTSQVHSNISTATAISPPAILCILLNALLFLITGFTAILSFQKYIFFLKVSR
jgi:hypothetical protein